MHGLKPCPTPEVFAAKTILKYSQHLVHYASPGTRKLIKIIKDKLRMCGCILRK